MRTRLAVVAATLLAVAAAVTPAAAETGGTLAGPPRVLVWGGTYGFRHSSITAGETTMLQLAQPGEFSVTVTENPADLSMETLRWRNPPTRSSRAGQVRSPS